ncbi:HAD family hydrolase [Dactylosporangium sp. NPDC049525]|uniref:HAD family hydrolase n=1 Tax=Dactylosporangium sp. NPDC049525 TaxID=3154730 RepID=UPI00342D36F3
MAGVAAGDVRDDAAGSDEAAVLVVVVATVGRLSAVETLGSTTVICTDKTGTLTENRMRVTQLWLPGAGYDTTTTTTVDDTRAKALAATAAACTTAQPPTEAQTAGSGDPTELALLRLAEELHVAVTPAGRDAARRAVLHFDAHLKRMSTVNKDAGTLVIRTKGALETVLPCCDQVLDPQGRLQPLDDGIRLDLQHTLDRYAARGLRVLAVAARTLDHGQHVPTDRQQAESGLTLLGLVAMVDPPRAGVAAAHRAGIRIHVITGDYGPTAAEIARQVGLGHEGRRIVAGDELDRLTDSELDTILVGGDEIVFARVSPEAKLRICEALRAQGETVAMTGDGPQHPYAAEPGRPAPGSRCRRSCRFRPCRTTGLPRCPPTSAARSAGRQRPRRSATYRRPGHPPR